MDKAFVQGHVVAHCDEDARAERRCGLEEYTLFVDGMVGIVLSRCFVKLWQNSGSVTRTAGNKRWIVLTVRIGVFRYHLFSHYMPTQSGGSAHGPRQEHLEHGTELKRSGDHVILGGDANSHLGPDETLNGFVGRFTTQTSSPRLSWQFVEWCVQEGLLHVDSYRACKRRGTWYHNYVGKWYEQDVIVSTLGGDGKRWRRLYTYTFAGADHRGKWISFLPLGRNKHFKYSRGVNEKPSHPLRWDLTRGRGDQAQRLVHSWHDSPVSQVETGKLTREATWKKTEVMRGVAEKVVGRESKTNVMPCLRACRKEVLLSKRRVAESYVRLHNARRTEDFASESERHRSEEK